VAPEPATPREREPRHPLAVLNLPLVVLIRAYQLTLSPLVGRHCRFQPTCSNYGLEACRRHHPVRAVYLTAWRIARCNPFGGHGHDPVPPYTRRQPPARRVSPQQGDK
jgi:uncharacterized protein